MQRLVAMWFGTCYIERVESKGKLLMTNLTKTDVNGIEYYVSDDGEVSGMSQSGLAAMCGITEASLRTNLLSDIRGRAKQLPKSLESLQGKDIDLVSTTNNGARVVKSEYCASIIEYYAFDARNSNNVAWINLVVVL